jgi:hypothetical protein
VFSLAVALADHAGPSQKWGLYRSNKSSHPVIPAAERGNTPLKNPPVLAATSRRGQQIPDHACSDRPDTSKAP